VQALLTDEMWVRPVVELAEAHSGGLSERTAGTEPGTGLGGRPCGGMTALLSLVALALLLVEFLLIARAVVDWVGILAPASGSRPGLARRVTHGLTEPLIGPVRRVLPPVRLGSVSIDLAFTVVFLAVVVLRTVVLAR
jgi:YggT family protein